MLISVKTRLRANAAIENLFLHVTEAESFLALNVLIAVMKIDKNEIHSFCYFLYA